MTRKVRIATATLESNFQSSTREQALRMVDEASAQRADILCLPEFAACDVVDGRMQPTPVPGPVTEAFADAAQRHGMYLIVPLIEQTAGSKHYNTAMLFDRRGEILGRYHKTHICMPGHGEGETMIAGDETPVFQTDFGTIAITLCMDLHYPELYTTLALQGAEIIFWPSGALDYTGDLIESLVNARAVDNQVYFVCSHYVTLPYLAGKSYGRSRVVDPMGRTRADTGHFPGLAVADIDLDQTYPMWYQAAMLQTYPTMRETIFKSRRPELYGKVSQPVDPSHYRRGNASTRTANTHSEQP